jgi:trimethylguanosine synthase
LSEIAELAGDEKVEVEEEWTGSKLKALTCYYGGLAEGQGHLF